MIKTLLIIIFISASCDYNHVNLLDRKLQTKSKEYFSSLKPVDADLSSAQVKLGKKLYFEKRLSKSNTISCNSCHNLETYGVDNQATSPGHSGVRGDRNSPTTLNAYKHFRQFWDGRAKDVEEQALGPLLNPIEHGIASEDDALKAIGTDEYVSMFKEAFGPRKDSLSFINIGRAIGAFERTLNASSPFDKYLNGDIRALSKKQRIGLSTFIKVGCTSCHSGELLGGSSYQKIGQVVPYPTHDKGRFNVTGKKRDLYKFKVPSLRNVEMTGPYFHDGSVKSLDQSIALMGKYQLGKDLSSKEIFYIKEFLKSLTSKI